MMTQTEWRNRITGHGEVDPRVLAEHSKNYRIHTGTQQRAMKAVLDGIGWVQGILVNERTGTILDGHMRVGMAIRQNEPTVPVDYVDMDEAEEMTVLATLDPMRALAVTDEQLYSDLREEAAAKYRGVLALLDHDASSEPEDDRAAMTVDHTAIFMQDEEEPADDTDLADNPYTGMVVRQVQFILDKPTYERIIDQFDQIMEREGFDTNIQVVEWLMRRYGNT